MTILPIDEINAMEDRLKPHFNEEGKIASRQDAEDIIDELLDLFQKVKGAGGGYLYVKAWFVKQFPNYKDIPNFINGKLRTVPVEAPEADNMEGTAAGAEAEAA